MKNLYISFDHFKRKMCKWRKDCALDVHGVLLSMLKDQFSNYNFDFCCQLILYIKNHVTYSVLCSCETNKTINKQPNLMKESNKLTL